MCLCAYGRIRVFDNRVKCVVGPGRRLPKILTHEHEDQNLVFVYKSPNKCNFWYPHVLIRENMPVFRKVCFTPRYLHTHPE